MAENEDKNEVFLVGEGRHGKPGTLRTQDDRTLRTWSLQVAQDATGAERLVLVENDRTPRQQMLLWDIDSATPVGVRWRGQQTTGEAHILLKGADAGGTLDPLLTSPELVLYNEARNPGEYVTPDDMPATNTTFYTNNNTGFLVDVEIEFVNQSGATATVTVDLVESGGAAAANRRILALVQVPTASVGIRLGPYTLEVSGTIQGLCSVADACTIHVHVLRLRRITP